MRSLIDIQKLENKFSIILRTETSNKVEQKKKLISSNLRAMKKGIVSSIFTLTFNLEAFESNIAVNSIVNAHVREFDQLFEGCRAEYKKFVPFCREKVDTLKDYAEQEIREIKKIHKIEVSIGKGVLISIGVGSSVYLLSWEGANIVLAPFRPALAAWSQAALSKLPTLLESMLQNIITPAAKICGQHMMEHRKIIVAHLGKQMFNLSIGMVAVLFNIISGQQHRYGFNDGLLPL